MGDKSETKAVRGIVEIYSLVWLDYLGNYAFVRFFSLSRSLVLMCVANWTSQIISFISHCFLSSMNVMGQSDNFSNLQG